MYLTSKGLSINIAGKQGETFSILRFLKAEMGLLDSLKDLLHSQFSFAVPLVQLQQTTESGLPLRAELHLQGISSLQVRLHLFKSYRVTL